MESEVGVYDIFVQDWSTHWRECDGSGGVSEQDALAETVEIMADHMLNSLSLTEEKRVDSVVVPKPAVTWESGSLSCRSKTTGLYADPLKGASQFTASRKWSCR